MLICYFFLNLEAGEQFLAICRGCIYFLLAVPAKIQLVIRWPQPVRIQDFVRAEERKDAWNRWWMYCFLFVCLFCARYYSRTCVISYSALSVWPKEVSTYPVCRRGSPLFALFFQACSSLKTKTFSSVCRCFQSCFCLWRRQNLKPEEYLKSSRV